MPGASAILSGPAAQGAARERQLVEYSIHTDSDERDSGAMNQSPAVIFGDRTEEFSYEGGMEWESADGQQHYFQRNSQINVDYGDDQYYYSQQ